AEEGHEGEIYEVTGPRLMTFTDVAAELSKATSTHVQFVDVPHDAFMEGMTKSGAPKDVIWMLDYLFATVLDGRNASLTDGVQRALGRQPKDFADYARAVAATGLWKHAA
ncbi:MAG: NmrA family transcriptional regulator, partial [Pseudomonadota bacterium]